MGSKNRGKKHRNKLWKRLEKPHVRRLFKC